MDGITGMKSTRNRWVNTPVMMMTLPSTRGPADLPATFWMGGRAFSEEVLLLLLLLLPGDSWFPSAWILSLAWSDMFMCIYCMVVISYDVGGKGKGIEEVTSKHITSIRRLHSSCS